LCVVSFKLFNSISPSFNASDGDNKLFKAKILFTLPFSTTLTDDQVCDLVYYCINRWNADLNTANQNLILVDHGIPVLDWFLWTCTTELSNFAITIIKNEERLNRLNEALLLTVRTLPTVLFKRGLLLGDRSRVYFFLYNNATVGMRFNYRRYIDVMQHIF